MTKQNKVKEYRENQYPKQRLRLFINEVTDIYENVPAEKRAEAILLLKNEHIEDVDLINQAVKKVGK
jgi:hypothetical protein